MASGFTDDAENKPHPYSMDPKSCTSMFNGGDTGFLSIGGEWVELPSDQIFSLMKEMHKATKKREQWEEKEGRKALEPDINWLIVDSDADDCASKIAKALALSPEQKQQVRVEIFRELAHSTHRKFLSDEEIQKHLEYAAEVRRESRRRAKVGRHAVVTRTPIAIGGHVVGESSIVAYEDGHPEFGPCQWRECGATAEQETLMGLQLCKAHFSEFYFPSEKRKRRRANPKLVDLARRRK